MTSAIGCADAVAMNAMRREPKSSDLNGSTITHPVNVPTLVIGT